MPQYTYIKAHRVTDIAIVSILIIKRPSNYTMRNFIQVIYEKKVKMIA